MNDTSGKLIASHASLAATFRQRLLGLLGRRELRRGEGLVLSPCRSVHTMFMNFPIDILFLDESGRVVTALGTVEPYRRSPAVRRARFVVELPAGTVADTGTKPGDRLLMQWNDDRGQALH